MVGPACNGKWACSCGVMRSLRDPLLVGPGIGGTDYSRVSLEFLETDAKPLRKNLTVVYAVLRACRGCGQLYALAHDEHDKLPEY
jgi:hypothetical protein